LIFRLSALKRNFESAMQIILFINTLEMNFE